MISIENPAGMFSARPLICGMEIVIKISIVQMNMCVYANFVVAI